ncbi:ankyrin repeat domain-containing protein [Dyadobacter sp. NIV53]|uniref:ankyrin repeat domain-containing protein n=1 Tax=Dyadobacter sp. NIV53 TaxID=2861765 RepID=UPI001C88559C|nr:ankyrin repeat domain-containing protein [Dyadobacter sp. NIV53]
MKTSDISDPLFLEAVEAIDSGNISQLQSLLQTNPQLITNRLDKPTEGYFKQPYLLWFIANNPIRIEKVPANIIEITGLLIKSARQNAPESFQEQIGYTLGLVESGRIVRECGVQIGLIDLLIDSGAKPGNAQAALAHGNIEAARHIIERSGQITLTAAVCLDRIEDANSLLDEVSMDEKQVALIAAAFYGKPDMTTLLITSGVDVNVFIDHGFHTHASALHQAVQSGSLETVKLLIQAGADTDARDKVFDGTPLDWASHMQEEENDENLKKKYKKIENYLLEISRL